MTSTPPPAGPRLAEVDALRGLAVIGILLSNVPEITEMRSTDEPGGPMLPIPAALELVAHQRFFPIFAFLFGVSLALFLDGSAARASRPRLLLLRRLVVLAGIGALHHLGQPGEALLPYAVIGLVVLLPATWLPRWAVAAGGAGLVVTALALGTSGLALVPGLFLLGLATARYRIPSTLHRHGRRIAVAGVLCAVVAAVTLPWQLSDLANSGFDTDSAVAGLAVAGLWTVALLGVLRTRARGGVLAVLTPLGRTALTQYVGATLLVLLLAGPAGLPDSTRLPAMLGVAAVIVVVGVLAARWWLARFRHGPLEWVWRCLTWWRIVPLRHGPEPAVISPR
ncbi:putative membrane protein YeiB [Pseudonocardia sediminis]|uniref:Putative membrane protein YeiB n=1 Tax=Pseudonocardia sediminis TaxID=1397368 RepID=A0A4Q7UWJ9_PSEST|nr:DUF418 domain-containing protein [Pseudonocardia sediminis]RZT86226.1 putative membrane protein YeiB [Pseudonocardia sediminis]